MGGEVGREVTIVEVGPRDGLQNEAVFVPTNDKVALINELTQSGIKEIEVGSFINPKLIPQFKDVNQVFSGISRAVGVCYSALVPNEIGARRAIEAGADKLAAFVSASETHNQQNVNMSTAESLAEFGKISRMAACVGLAVRGYIVMAFGCPYEGPILPEKVCEMALKLRELGAGEIVLGDTIGVANPFQVTSLIYQLRQAVPGIEIAVHFHNSRGTAMANVLAAYQSGITRFDTSIGGVGGCPHTPGAAGNIATEDLVWMFESMGVSTELNWSRLAEVPLRLQQVLGRELPSHNILASNKCPDTKNRVIRRLR